MHHDRVQSRLQRGLQSGKITTMTESNRRNLDERGYVVLENFTSPEMLQELQRRVEELLEQEGSRAGSEFKQEPGSRRLANLVDKGEVFERVIAAPEILELVGYVLGPNFKLSSLNMRSANPYSDWVQPLHCDAGAIRDEQGYWVCNTIWMLDAFTTENGATRVIPGSHRWGKLPQQVVDNCSMPHGEQILVTGEAGTVVVMNAHLWHGGTANHSSAERRAVHAFYTRWDKPQQQYQKKLIRPEVQRRMTGEVRRLLALDDTLNDQLSSETTGQSGFLR
jgi:ectoine hydroxylase-related dioxygenase (phytanoyl-CoA dioxygenase family)